MPRACQSVWRERNRWSITAAYVVRHDCLRHVPALPARLRRAVAEVDVLAVVAVPGVPAADLVEHRAAHEQERTEHPVRRNGLGRPLVEGVVVALRLVRRSEPANRRPADDRSAHRREAPARRLPAAVGPPHLRAGDPAPRGGVGERDEGSDGAWLGDRVGIRVEDVLARGRSDAEVDVRGQRQRPRIFEDADSVGNAGRRARDVRDDRRSRRPARRERGANDASSLAWPCETTTAETFTPRVSPGRRRASSPRPRAS